MQTKFDIIGFKKFSPSEWKKRYKSDIRVNLKWSKIKIEGTGLALADHKTKMTLPWYGKDKCWMDGKPKKVSIGESMNLVRVPALRIMGTHLDNSFLILDGCHRLTELKPAIVLIDWISTSTLCYFTDLRNKYYKLS